MLAGLACAPAMADETVSIGGSRAVLIKPKALHASVILMPGADGNIRPGDQGDIHGLTGNQLAACLCSARIGGACRRCGHRSH
jgi:hypothetical protein